MTTSQAEAPASGISKLSLGPDEAGGVGKSVMDGAGEDDDVRVIEVIRGADICLLIFPFPPIRLLLLQCSIPSSSSVVPSVLLIVPVLLPCNRSGFSSLHFERSIFIYPLFNRVIWRAADGTERKSKKKIIDSSTDKIFCEAMTLHHLLILDRKKIEKQIEQGKKVNQLWENRKEKSNTGRK